MTVSLADHNRTTALGKYTVMINFLPLEFIKSLSGDSIVNCSAVATFLHGKVSTGPGHRSISLNGKNSTTN